MVVIVIGGRVNVIAIVFILAVITMPPFLHSFPLRLRFIVLSGVVSVGFVGWLGHVSVVVIVVAACAAVVASAFASALDAFAVHPHD